MDGSSIGVIAFLILLLYGTRKSRRTRRDLNTVLFVAWTLPFPPAKIISRWEPSESRDSRIN